MNHTPGPWEVRYTKAATRIHANDGHGDVAVVPVRYSKTDNLAENAANAHLIASAPELLEALKALYEHCSMVHKHWGDGCNQHEADSAITAGLAAIAKAEGRE